MTVMVFRRRGVRAGIPKGAHMEAPNTKSHDVAATPLTPPTLQRVAAPQEEKGAIGAALLVWLFGGGLGLALLVFVLLKMC